MIWRLIYTNTEAIDLFETNGITATPYQIFDTNTQEEGFDKIDELKITYYYPLNENEILLFSGGNRTIINKEEI
jgi:hypothetical protein